MSAGTRPVRVSDGTGVSALLALSLCLLVLVASLGSSAVEPRLPGAGHAPPWTFLGAHPSQVGSIALVVAALAIGGCGVGLGLRALSHGWQPRPSRLVAAGLIAVVALCLVPATGSADPESYAAYGRMAVLHLDPYTTTPQQMVTIGDPVAAAVEDPWKDTSSVYGPLATAEQRFAASVGHRSVRTTVVVLMLVNAAAFVLTGLLLLAAAADAAGRRRAALLWLVNPLLLYELVSGAHVDALVAFPCAAGILALTRSRVLAGVLLGVAAAVKLPALAVLAGALWAARWSRRDLVALVVGAGTVLAAAYTTVGWHALRRTVSAGALASWATPWRGLISLLDATIGRPESRTIASVVAVVIGLAFVICLLRKESRAPAVDARDRVRSAAVAGFVCYFGYLLAAPYALPWYDGPAWMLLALVAASAYDWLLLARTTAMAPAYVTHDEQHLAPHAHAVVVAFRNVVSPVVLAGVLVVTALVALRDRPATRTD